MKWSTLLRRLSKSAKILKWVLRRHIYLLASDSWIICCEYLGFVIGLDMCVLEKYLCSSE